MVRLILRTLNGESAAALANASRAWRTSSTTSKDSLLFVASAHDEAVLRGAFQRGHGPQRGSGGGAVTVGPGRVWLSLALSRSDALVSDATPDKILNRYVRPLLRALGKVTSMPVSYFGRDWISAGHRPVGFVGFAHDATTGRALFEAIVAVSAPFAVATDSPSFMGKSPATLAEISGRTITDEIVIDALVKAYSNGVSEIAAGTFTGTGTFTGVTDWDEDSSPWLATTDTAIGTLGCGPDRHGRLRLGGDLMASADAIERLEDAINSLPPAATPDSIGRIVDDAFTTRGAVLFGVRSLASIRDVIVSARTSLGERSRT